MALRYVTPRELIEALHERGSGARAELHALLQASFARLIEDLRSHYELKHASATLTRNALHAAETYLRTQPLEAFAGMSWSAFRAAVLLHLAKLASQPYGQSVPADRVPGQLPRSRRYHSEVLFLPYERVGDTWFSGDWFSGLEAADGSLWILIADITGHGYHAYLLASTLAGVWQHCWESAPTCPSDMLASMHDLLEDCLPEGVYVEGTLVRLHPDGEVVAAPAGGSRIMLRRGRQNQPVLLQLRGAWLGLLRPSPHEQRTWTLQDGDELLLATDGLYDQLHEQGARSIVERLHPLGQKEGLFDHLRQLLEQELARSPQKDDITMVFLRRHERTTEATTALTSADLSAPNETRDVSV
jgi:serine phosphatase RsbU (regulator of sigma subunit)